MWTSKIYIDTQQSSVLFQTGVIDPEAVPQNTKSASAAAIRCVM
jgi:hypothetical protein